MWLWIRSVCQAGFFVWIVFVSLSLDKYVFTFYFLFSDLREIIGLGDRRAMKVLMYIVLYEDQWYGCFVVNKCRFVSVKTRAH